LLIRVFIDSMSDCIIKADLSTCRDAWLDGDKLKGWLADAADIRDPDFCLTSRLPNVSGRHRIIGQNDLRLEFEWFVDGCKTRLAVEFEDLNDTTRVVVIHDFPSPLPPGVQFPAGEAYGGQVWDFALLQLKSFIESGKMVMTLVWPDNLHRIEHEITIHAPVSRVWRILTSAEELRKLELVSEGALVEPMPGGRYSFGWANEENHQIDGPGHVTEWVEQRKLSHTWYGGRDSVISWDLEEQAEETTLLRFSHSGLVFSFAETWSYKLGWANHLLEMKGLLERLP
jgi:uncharacterized protein YndB with AHSA1/START domain